MMMQPQADGKPGRHNGMVVDAEPVEGDPVISAPIGIGMPVMEANMGMAAASSAI